MKTDTEREQLIQGILVMLYQAYDSTLDEIYALLKKIEDEEDEEDLKAYDEAKEDIQINGTIPWEKVKKEMKKDVA
ncbi:hypothetical protein [Calothrix rhizosoleniae]|uniref:hypothetical protein n=1 Tax=Calothrix rhizosoleniae TaxID=888997 RepID=UPI000B49DFEB|nr:hypothetical protein [Calothrix rhizosoleniae]